MADEVVEEVKAEPTAEQLRGVAIVADALAVIRAQNENVKIGLSMITDDQRAVLQAAIDNVVIGK